ncbi:uncharacterized protein LOC129222624 [Uloborus diversus]|uniref:uncharacterized protein LOC129222624 n=1 Tax=Uloborus diversus TaxID=327109 RepID=UPI002408F53F|nr:uncharacterized protein LOC129222624 [Uloborus diversus]
MDFYKKLLGLGLLLCTAFCLASGECDENEFQTCVSQMSDFAEGYSFQATSEALLKETCGSKMQTITCVKEFVQKCMKKGDRDVFGITTGPKLEMVEQLCTDGTKINTGYLGNIECWQKISNDTKLCNKKFEQSQNAINSDDLEDRLRIFHSCCAFDWHRKCKVRAAESKCNARASSFIDYISTLLGGKVLAKLCYESFPSCIDELYGADEMDDMADSSTFIASPIISIYILLYVSLHFFIN